MHAVADTNVLQADMRGQEHLPHLQNIHLHPGVSSVLSASHIPAEMPAKSKYKVTHQVVEDFS